MTCSAGASLASSSAALSGIGHEFQNGQYRVEKVIRSGREGDEGARPKFYLVKDALFPEYRFMVKRNRQLDSATRDNLLGELEE